MDYNSVDTEDACSNLDNRKKLDKIIKDVKL